MNYETVIGLEVHVELKTEGLRVRRGSGRTNTRLPGLFNARRSRSSIKGC